MINETWGVVSMIGFWGWVLATVGFILKVFPTTGIFRGRPAILWGCSVILFYSLWVLSMVRT